ncbi:MAG: hypothetical protein ACRD9R_19890 [Pyrinomonadaceae bacterium]
MEKTIELIDGYTDPKKVSHREVVISKHLRGADLFAIDSDPQNTGPTVRECLILRAAITKFGGLKMPVAVSVLLALDSIDRDDLLDAYNQLQEEERGGRAAKILSDSKIQLALGYEHEGVRYDVVEFGSRITGQDFVEADALELDASRRAFFLVGRQVSTVSQSDGGLSTTGQLSLEACGKLCIHDLYALRGAAEIWRQSFRLGRAKIQDKHGADGSHVGAGHGMEREADSATAG